MMMSETVQANGDPSVTAKDTTVTCTSCWRKPYLALSKRGAKQIAQHHQESNGHQQNF